MPLAEAYIYASRIMVDSMFAQDVVEGIGAFVVQHAPLWQDR